MQANMLVQEGSGNPSSAAFMIVSSNRAIGKARAEEQPVRLHSVVRN